MIPMEFVNNMRKEGKLIMGIGHRVKSVSAGQDQMNKSGTNTNFLISY